MAAHGALRDDDEPMAEMNLIPMIDIALTLLIILMVTSAFIHKPGIALKLPASATREGAPESNKDLVVLIARNGTFYMDGARVTDAAVEARLARAAAANRQARVLIKGDRDVPYGRVMRAMDLARQAGLARVVLPTDPTPPAATP